ncbi:DUF4139 domain-containing protein [Streptomyces sp. SKN60]|uniref:DUF4139 domain-containing protein n=1 Tax=Streptomyces sp. SKN60 TaxID=2855506 RepID=UPI002248735A|nr:DUF4139 domain-containing protein [Streptomyces sp. SKN60]MCX2182784.1 DUF4139 domain-containing protein [Streptomyces sp. SKN60]
MTTTPHTPVPNTPDPASADAPPIALPVTAVTCLEDRAHVERTARLTLEAGVRRLRLGPVSALAVDRTLHAELTPEQAEQAEGPEGALDVLDVRIVREWTPRGPRPSADDSALRRRVHALTTEQTALEQRRDRLATRLDLLGGLAADLLREIGEGTGYGETDPARWTRELDRIDAERDAYAERLGTVGAELTRVGEELAAATEAMYQAEEEPAELVGHVELTVRAAAAGPALLRVTHLTPCALWRPAYRAVLDGESLTLESEAVVWQRTGEDWADVRLTLSTARSAQATEPPKLVEDRLTLVDRSAAERRTIDLEMREETISALGPLPVVGLPGVDDGGETRVLSAPAPVGVPSDGRAHRVPLSSFTTPAVAEYACSPELSPLVTQLVRFDNRSGHALLTGPVDLVRASGFSGRGTLDFTAPGAPAELAFGSQDDYRVVRRVEETRDTTALSQRTVVSRTVRVHLSRLSAPGEEGDRLVTVRERIPVPEVSAVQVRVRKEACSPVPDEVDADGIVRWDAALPPGGRRTLTLSYEITAKSNTSGL